jgi:hypothetical protein
VPIYLYGLILGRNAHLVPAHITGVDATVLRVTACEDGGLGAIVSTLQRTPRRDSLDDVRAHDHALQSVVNHGATAAAVRFGQTFPSEDDLRRHVAEQGPRVGRLLDDYDGYVEMRVLMAQSAPESRPRSSNEEPVPGAGPGRAYLERLRSSSANDRLRGLGVAGVIGPVVREERVDELPAARGLVFSHLIRRADEASYRSSLATNRNLAEATVVGPLALYSFTGPPA